MPVLFALGSLKIPYQLNSVVYDNIAVTEVYGAMHILLRKMNNLLLLCGVIFFIQACSTTNPESKLDRDLDAGANNIPTAPYLIGAGDELRIFVWGNPELSGEVPVRPDGRITTPLVEDLVASGKTPSQLARELEKRLKRYMKKPVVTVTVTQFVGRYTEQIRVVGQVGTPQILPYREYITLLDVIIAVNGMTEYAAGNRAIIVRTEAGQQKQIKVRLDDLLESGDISANLRMQPGDVLFVPEAWF